MRALLRLSALIGCAALAAAQAQTETRSTELYRCGPDGKDLRSTPCPDDARRPAQTVQHDQPSAAQQREARERARQTQAQADAMQRERLAREAAAKPALATGIRGHRGEPAVGAASQPSAKEGKDGNKSGSKKKSSKVGKKAAAGSKPAAPATKP